MINGILLLIRLYPILFTKMNTNNFDNFESFSTKFTADEINELIGECLADTHNKIKYNVIEDVSEDKTTWSIVFFLFRSIIHYDTWSKTPSEPKILIVFQEGKDGDTNFLKFIDCSTAKSHFSRDKILILNSFITEKEKEKKSA